MREKIITAKPRYKGGENLIFYMTSIYSSKGNYEIAAGFRRNFSRKCKPHFIGLWDTVASIGWGRRKQISNNRLNHDVTYRYQALALDESSYHFRVSQWDETDVPVGQTIERCGSLDAAETWVGKNLTGISLTSLWNACCATLRKRD